ncbi:hypothetical protein [Chitinophaga sp. HK235]|uniref:hypothetical protein n=1 Tax=Chitinophaga sp. HK235 TaxID=2952571 RepID=UPI001BAE2A19|nr:hypothetical protein [Chitinophaga sp. HK235]
MCQRTPLVVIIACIGILLNCCLPVSSQAQFRKNDRLLYRITRSILPAQNVCEKVYQLTVLHTSKHDATIACTLLYINDSVTSGKMRYHFISSDSTTWHAWSTETAAQIALLYHPVILTVRNNDSTAVTQGLEATQSLAAILEDARQRWNLPPQVVADLQWRIPMHLTMDVEKLFRHMPPKMEVGYQWRQGYDSCRVEKVTPEMVTISSFIPGVPTDSTSLKISGVYTLLRDKGTVDKLLDTLQLREDRIKYRMHATNITRIELLPADTPVPVTDMVRFDAQVYKGPWKQESRPVPPKK